MTMKELGLMLNYGGLRQGLMFVVPSSVLSSSLSSSSATSNSTSSSLLSCEAQPRWFSARVCRGTDRTESDTEPTEPTEPTATDLAQPRPGPGSTPILQRVEIPAADFWRASGLCRSVRLVKSVWTRPAQPHNLPPRLD